MLPVSASASIYESMGALREATRDVARIVLLLWNFAMREAEARSFLLLEAKHVADPSPPRFHESISLALVTSPASPLGDASDGVLARSEAGSLVVGETPSLAEVALFCQPEGLKDCWSTVQRIVD